MSGTVTLAQLRTRIRDRAKMSGSSFVSDSEILTLINNSIASMHDLIIKHRGEEYFETKSTLTIVNGTKEYALPNDFYKLCGVMDEDDIPLDTFDRRERDHQSGPAKYRIANNKFHLNRDDFSGVLTIYYVPLSTSLSVDADTCNFYNGWDEYVTIDCAKTLLEMEESDASHLERQLFKIEERIAQSAPKDINRPGRIADVVGQRGIREIY